MHGLEDEIESPGHHHVENGYGEEATDGEAEQPLGSSEILRCGLRIAANKEFRETAKIHDRRHNGQQEQSQSRGKRGLAQRYAGSRTRSRGSLSSSCVVVAVAATGSRNGNIRHRMNGASHELIVPPSEVGAG